MATNDEAETAAAGANPYSPAETPQGHEQPNSGAAAGQKVGGLGFNVGGTFVGVGVAPPGRSLNGVGISLGGVMVGVTTGMESRDVAK